MVGKRRKERQDGPSFKGSARTSVTVVSGYQALHFLSINLF